MKTIFALLMMILAFQANAQYGEPTDGFAIGQRVIYTPDNSAGTLIGIDRYHNTLCIKFDYARPDGAYERCEIFAYLVRVNPSRTPTSDLYVGQRIIYTPDNSAGRLLSIDTYYNEVCVKFDYPRPDGAYERCEISSNLIYPQFSTEPTTRLIIGKRTVYTPDNSFGILIAIDSYYNTVCMKFDYPRPDGAYERCEIPAKLVYQY